MVGTNLGAIEGDDPIADVRAAMAQVDGKEPEAVEQDTLVAEPEANTEGETSEQKADKKRDDKGRFAKAEAQAKEAATAEPEIKATKDSTEAQSHAGQTASGPPTSWSPEAKAEWAKLSPALQQAVIKRESEVVSGFAQKSNELRPLKEIESVIAPRRAQYQRFGFKSDAEAVNHLFTLSDSMERDPAGTIAFLARHYGVDGAQPQNNGAVDPRLAQPQPTFDIEKKVNDALGLAFARKEIEDFASDTEKYPHFAELRPFMSHLLTSGMASDLPSAYESALYATPHLRSQVLAAQTQAKTETRVEAQTQRATKAKAATRASLSGAPHGTPAAKTVPKGVAAIDDAVADVRAAMEQIGA